MQLPGLPALPERWVGSGDLVLTAVRGDLFRPQRVPAPLPFGARPAASITETPAHRPRLSIAGISGPPFLAILEGVPGRERGQVVRAGDVTAGLRVRRIDATTVHIDGPDTAWVLTVRRGW